MLSNYAPTRQRKWSLAISFDPYVKEWRPSKDDRQQYLYPFVLELLQGAAADVPQCTDLLGLLDDIFSDDTAEPDLTPVHQLLLGLIESGQRHTGHGHRKVPEYGVDPCARKGSTSEGKQYVYCRYLFPRLLRLFEGFKRAVVEDDRIRCDCWFGWSDRNFRYHLPLRTSI